MQKDKNHHAELINHFKKLISPLYTKEEVDELKKIYEKISNTNSAYVKDFLSAVDDFLLATSPQEYFKKLRDISIDNNELDPNTMLRNMTSALEKIKKSSEDAAHEKMKSDAEVLNSAFQYGSDVVKKRMEKLKEINDTIHDAYNKSNSELQKILHGKDKEKK